MKILSVAKKALLAFTGEGFEADVEKRKGLYVCRPVLNGDQWFKWATKFGIPNPVPANEMHVSQLYSVVDVKVKPESDVISIFTGRAVFVALGAQDECLCLKLPAWQLQDRNWELTMAGAVETWPTYKPHLTFSYDAKGFEISDEALRAMPETVILGGEIHAALGEKVNLEAAANDDAEQNGADVVIVTEIYRSAAKKILESEEAKSLDVLQEASLRDIVKRKKVDHYSADVLKKLKPDLPSESAVRKAVERDVVMTVRPFEGEIAKRLGEDSSTLGTEEERHLIWGIASVATVKGQGVKDLDGDEFTPRAIEDFTIDLMKNQRAGKFEHEGEACNHIVQALFLSEDLQKALGFDLGYEPLVICTEVPDPAAWAEVKKGDWMFSIAGRFIYYEDQADA